MAKPALGLPCAPPPSMVNLTRTGAGQPPRHWPKSSGVALPDSQMNLRSVSRRASRVLLGATLAFVALGAVSATAMAAPVSGLTLPPDGKVKQVSGASHAGGAGRRRAQRARRGAAALTATTTSPMPSASPSRTRSAASPNYCFVQRGHTEARRRSWSETLTCSRRGLRQHPLVLLPGRPGGACSTSSSTTRSRTAPGAPVPGPASSSSTRTTGNGFCGVAST